MGENTGESRAAEIVLESMECIYSMLKNSDASRSAYFSGIDYASAVSALAKTYHEITR